MKKKSKKKLGIRSRIHPIAELPRVITILLYGRAGTGKTTIAGTFPGPVLLVDISEKGTDSVSDVEGMEVLKAESWSDIEDVYWMLKDEDHPYKTVALDAVHAMQDLAIKKAKGPARADDEQTTKHDYMKASGLMKTWLVNFRDLEEKGIHVVFICHDRRTDGEEGVDDEGMLSPEVGPRLMPSLASLLTGAVKVVGHTFIKETLQKSATLGKKATRKIDYCLRIGPHGYYTTKIRSPKDSETPEFLKDPTFKKILGVLKGEQPVTADKPAAKKKLRRKVR